MGASRVRFLALLLLAALPVGSTAQEQDGFAERIISGALAQVGVTLHYDGSYRQLDYPGGDVPIERGVCTDVIVRAYRAVSIDLQVLVHEDMRRAFHAYPRLWGLSRPDPNIDPGGYRTWRHSSAGMAAASSRCPITPASRPETS